MPTPFDLLSEKLDDQADPDDQLRLQLGQDQGANLAGGPQQGADGQPQFGAVPRMPPPTPPPGISGPSPNVPGPLAALAPKKTPTIKPHIKLKSRPPPKKGKPKIKLKSKPAAQSSALQNFLSTIGSNPGS